MKTTLIPEAPVFTLNIDGKLIYGMRASMHRYIDVPF